MIRHKMEKNLVYPGDYGHQRHHAVTPELQNVSEAEHQKAPMSPSQCHIGYVCVVGSLLMTQ